MQQSVRHATGSLHVSTHHSPRNTTPHHTAPHHATPRRQGKEKNVDEERSILIAGSKRGGKSSVVLRFLDRLTDVPKPTMALEYTFGRRYSLCQLSPSPLPSPSLSLSLSLAPFSLRSQPPPTLQPFLSSDADVLLTMTSILCRPHSNNLGKDIAHLWELGRCHLSPVTCHVSAASIAISHKLVERHAAVQGGV